ncbi:basic proline-rich protein [Drosophila biarmipes]|uniref:basic proline-rich protein n=1 Tax=Drosophila biarmipes TaxID=125945 RepID=UPI0007E6FBAA|nr:basic proline-rich protein [Drosophila biarmipes]
MRSQRRLLLPALLLGLLLLVGGISAGDSAPQDVAVSREKRGTVTLDFGLLLRNLLLKSAQLSSAKASLVKTTRRPRTTTTAAPPPSSPPPPPRSRRPIWHPFFSSGYLPLDYDTDYADPPAPRPPAPPPPPPPTAQPSRRPVRPPLRPRPRPTPTPPPPPPPNYDYDYDYDALPPAPAPTEAPPPPPPPPPPSAPTRPRPRPRPRPQPEPQQRRPAQLGDRLIYQYAQPTDTFFRSRAVAEAADVPDSGDVDDADADTGTGAGAGATGPAESEPPAPTAPRFLVNYESDSDFGTPPTGQQDQDQVPPGASSIPASPSAPGYFAPLELGGLNLNRFPTPSQQQYFYN